MARADFKTPYCHNGHALFSGFVVGCPFIICFQSLGTYYIYIYMCVAGVLAYRVGPSKIDNDPLFMHKLRYHLNAEAWGPSGSSDKIEL